MRPASPMDKRHARPVAMCAVLAMLATLTLTSSLFAGGGAVPDGAADPAAVFDALVDRYRRIEAYQDTVDLVEIVSRGEQRPHRVETRLACRIENDRLRIDSPGGQVRSGVGLGGPVSRSAAVESLVLRYNLWIAPHMVLRFKENPLADFRPGVPGGFVPASAEPASWRDRQYILLVLKAVDPADDARYELWVNPDSMLIERITGRQTLPDGADYQTSLSITPSRVDAEPIASGD